MRKIIALVLCLCLLAALAGCGGSKIGQYEEEPAPAEDTAEPEATPEEDAEAPAEDTEDAEEAPDEDAAPADETPAEDAAEAPEADVEDAEATPEPTPEPIVGDLAAIYAKYDPDTVVATADGEDVTWEEYHYWLNYFVQYTQLVALQNGITLSGWDANELSADHTNGEVVTLNAEQMLRQYHAVPAMAKERGTELTEEDEAQLLSIFEQNADSVTGDQDGTCTDEEAAAFEDYLAEQFISRDFFDYMNEMGALSNDMFAAEYGESGEKYPDEDALAYADSLGIRAAKHILLLTMDMSTGQALSEEEIAEKKAKIDDIHSQLAAVADDPEALEELFDQLTADNTEDTGYTAYPDGYTYVPGVMVSEFEGAVSALPEGGLSEVVETSYGYHVIMRVPVQPDAVVMDTSGQSVNLRAAAADAAFGQELSAAMEKVDIQWADGFEDFDVGAVFGPEK